MKTTTSFKPRPAGTLKEATDRLIGALGGAVAAAEGARISASRLRQYSDPDDPESFIAADMVLALEARAGVPHVTEFLAHASGYGLLKLGGADEGCLSESARAILAESADVIERMIAALSDNSCDAAEAGRIVAEIDQLLRAAATARVLAVQKMGEGR